MKKTILSIALTGLIGCFNATHAQTYTYCTGDTVTLGLPAYTGALQWQQSFDSITWTDIPGATYQPWQFIIGTIPQYYRAKVTDGTCNPVYSQIRYAVDTCFTCGVDSIQDIDGNWYQTVLIGNQCWLQENLKSTNYSDGTPLVDGTAVGESIE